MSSEVSTPDPSVILDLLEAFRRSKTMFAAVSLGVFDTLERGPMSLAGLAETLSLNHDALERLLDACVGLQLLERAGVLYKNTPAAAAYLCKQSPARLTGYLNYSNAILWKLWANLEDAIREGTNRWQQTFGWDGPIFSSFFKTEAAMREFLMGMHGQGLLSSPHVVAAFDLGRFRRLVDLGGATGHLAIAACQRYPGMKAVVFDLPEAGPLAREIVGASPAADRIEVKAGDFFVDALPEGDLYAVGRILHDWTEAKVLSLLNRIFDRLPSGGALLIAEKLIDEDRTGPRWAHMQNLGMLLYTEGKERTLSDYKTLLHQVGFSDVNGSTTPTPLDAVLALKP
ncbi:MAG TPA: class I SAM-dependent methyltransferase [Isosphaeraceae bacterium]|nr:class I SAM-dependent methyltransferase [Isosphaeraceae bacterium]